MCAALQLEKAKACLQISANIEPAAIVQAKSLSQGSSMLLTTGLSDSLIAFLVGFNVRLRLEYADQYGAARMDEKAVLNTAFPGIAEADLSDATPRVIALRMLVVLRLYQQEVSEMVGRLVNRPPQA